MVTKIWRLVIVRLEQEKRDERKDEHRTVKAPQAFILFSNFHSVIVPLFMNKRANEANTGFTMRLERVHVHEKA